METKMRVVWTSCGAIYDGNWYCLFNDYRAYHTSHMNCYSLNAFEKWCEANGLIAEMK